METQKFLHIDNQFEVTEMPNGLLLISGDVFRCAEGRKRVYHVFVAGGRMADEDPPGAGPAFVNALSKHIQAEFKEKLPADAFACSIQHGHIGFRYTHHGKDQHDAKCLELLIQTIMTNPPSVKSFEASKHNIAEKKQYMIDDFWSWFSSKVSPDWLRMCIPTWTEAQLAERSNRNQCLRYRDRLVHPANTLVFSSEPCLHEDLAERLQALNACDADAKRYVCRAPSVASVYDDYPFAKSTKKKQDLLIYYPLSADRFVYVQLVLAFYALFGENGFLGTFLKKQRLILRPELHTAFWPQPFAYIKLSASHANLERTLELVRRAQLAFAELRQGERLTFLRNAAEVAAVKAANPFDVLRDEWLCGLKPRPEQNLSVLNTEGMHYLVREYLSESRMGVIRGLPEIANKASIFDSI